MTNCDHCETERRERPRMLRGPSLRMRMRVPVLSGLLERDYGRSDLPVIGPEDTPGRIARRLV